MIAEAWQQLYDPIGNAYLTAFLAAAPIIAAAAVRLVGSEAATMHTTLTYSLGLLGYVCVWTLALSYVT